MSPVQESPNTETVLPDDLIKEIAEKEREDHLETNYFKYYLFYYFKNQFDSYITIISSI